MHEIANEGILQIMEEMNSLEYDGMDTPNAKRYSELSQKLDDDPSQWNFTQDQFVRFMKLAREGAWDIPSALMSACGHLDEDEYFFMHRPIMELPGVEYGEGWEPADRHFKEVHDLDLKDERINWEFDT